MKMTRDQLKKIIKECLVELLAEGMGSALTEGLAHPQMPRPTGQPSRAPTSPARRPSALDSMRYGQPTPQPRQSAPAMNEHIRNATTDPVLAAIMADTAQTTLLQQVERRGGPPVVGGGKAEQVVASYNPDELIGSITGQSADQMNARWSQAAFAPSRHLPGMGSMNHIVNDFDPYSGK